MYGYDKEQNEPPLELEEMFFATLTHFFDNSKESQTDIKTNFETVRANFNKSELATQTEIIALN